MFDSLHPHGLQHARLPCPSLSSGVCSNSCPLSQWWHLTISSSVTFFSLCPQSFPASGAFPVSWLLASDDQNTGVSASASVLPTVFRVEFPEKSFLNIDTYLTKNIFFLHESQVLTNWAGTTWRKPFLLHCYSATCGNKSLISYLLILDLKWNLFLFDVFFLLILNIRENHHENKFSVSSRLK